MFGWVLNTPLAVMQQNLSESVYFVKHYLPKQSLEQLSLKQISTLFISYRP